MTVEEAFKHYREHGFPYAAPSGVAFHAWAHHETCAMSTLLFCSTASDLARSSLVDSVMVFSRVAKASLSNSQ
jgi:hypothetical protein